MLTPMQINSQRFTQAGKGGYKASEVDAFLQKVYKYYSKLYSDNNTLNERLSAISPVIDEYNRNKTAIANALLSAQTAADSKIEAANTAAESAIKEAEEKAETIMKEKAAEADAYYIDKTHEADEKLASLQREYSKLKTESDAYKEKYLTEIRGKVDVIISGANEKAAVIVAKAYEDARVARERADKIIDEANEELRKIQEETDKIKKELSEIISLAKVVADSAVEIRPLENTPAENVDIAEESVIPVEIPEFDFGTALQDEEEPVVAEIEEKEDVIIYDGPSDKSEPQETAADDGLDLFSHSTDTKNQQADIPDASLYISKIFDSDSDDDFGFGDLISES